VAVVCCFDEGGGVWGGVVGVGVGGGGGGGGWGAGTGWYLGCTCGLDEQSHVGQRLLTGLCNCRELEG